MNTLVIGKGASGITTFVKHLCVELDSNVVVFVDNHCQAREYADITSNVYSYRDDDLKAFMEDRSKRDETSKTVTLVFTNCARNFFKSNMIRQLVVANHQYNINTIFELQHCMDIPPYMRMNTNHIWAAREHNTKLLKNLQKMFNMEFVTYKLYHFTGKNIKDGTTCTAKAPFPTPKTKPYVSIPISYKGIQFITFK